MIAPMLREVAVIGGGVIGLSTAIRLREGGCKVTVVARELSPRTTSDVAAAVWYPYRAAPRERVAEWGRVSFEAFRSLAAVPESGVSMIEGQELFGEPVADPWWRDMVDGFRRLSAEALPPGYADGCAFTVPLIDTSIYLPYLHRRFLASGGAVQEREVGDLAEPLAEYSIVVNCTGLGARTLARDASVYPTRGQIVRVKPIALDRFLLDQYGPQRLAYVVPRRHDCILGGTAEENDERLQADPATARDILRRCAALDPACRGVEILGHAVGLRPCRPEVRLDVEPRGAHRFVIHNYGHGGAGVTLSWGCAEEVAAIVRGATR